MALQDTPRTLRVGYLLGQFPVLSQTFVYDEIRRSVAQGIDIQVISLGPPQDDIERGMLAADGVPPTRFISSKADRKGRLADYAASGLLEAVRSPLRAGRLLGTGKPADIAKALAISSRSRDILRSIDILHCHFGPAGVLAAMLKQMGLTDAKIITTFLGHDLSWILDHRGPSYYRALFDQGDLFLPISDCFAQRLTGAGCRPERIAVHHVGTDCSQIGFAARQPQDGQPIRLISVGRMVEKKGHEFSLRALGDLRRRRPDIAVTFDIVGGGPLEAELKGLATDQGITDIVRFHGGLPHGQTLALMEQAHVFLLPSVTASDGDMEGIPVGLMEAMAKGLPVISTRHSGIPELVQHERSGLLVAERDATGLSQALEQMLTTPARWPEMGRAGRDWVEAEFDMNRLVLRLHEHYRALTA
jgi:colanic acid/amylovoran biosynthesis glycosyltransferase